MCQKWHVASRSLRSQLELREVGPGRGVVETLAVIGPSSGAPPFGGASFGGASFGGASFGIAASILSRNRCPPSPCVRLSGTRSTTAAPYRPGPVGRRWTQPDGPAGMRGARQGPERFAFHSQLARRRRSPTLSLRHRHAYPAALHRGLPDGHPPAHPQVCRPGLIDPNGYAPHPGRIHQMGAGQP